MQSQLKEKITEQQVLHWVWKYEMDEAIEFVKKIVQFTLNILH